MPLRIAIDARHLSDFGIGTYIRNLVRTLAQIDRENSYLLIALRPDEPDLKGLPRNFEVLPYSRSDQNICDQVLFPLFLQNLSADLFHVPHNRVSLGMPRPYVITIHDLSSILYEQEQGYRKNLRLFRIRRGLARASRIITVSAATRRDVENLLGVPSSKIRQVYNAPDPIFTRFLSTDSVSPEEQQARENERSLTLARYQINYPFILYAGMIRPQKNIPRLVEAFAVLRGDLEKHPVYKDLRLIIIGDEISRYPSVRQSVMRTRVEDAVRFLGFVSLPTLRTFYEAAAVFVFPSLYEGFGLPPLEAMGTGTPVVTSNVSSLPEVVGDAAVLVNPENVFDIAKGIKEVLLDESLRNQLIRKGIEQARRFSWERTARQVLEIYQEVAAGRP